MAAEHLYATTYQNTEAHIPHYLKRPVPLKLAKLIDKIAEHDLHRLFIALQITGKCMFILFGRYHLGK